MTAADAPSTVASDVSAEYARRRDLHAEQAAGLEQRGRWLSHARLVAFVTAAAGAWFAFGVRVVAAGWVAVPALAFVALVVVHDRVLRRRRRAERAMSHYEAGLARLEDRWMGSGESGERYADAKHLYAADLDLFGPGSVFEKLCSARTRAGQDRLAAWLCEASPPDVVRERQAAVEELRGELDLREDLALVGERVEARLAPEALRDWGAAGVSPPAPAARGLAPVLAGTAVVSLFGWILFGWGPTPFALALAAEAGFAWRWRARVSPILADVGRPMRDLDLLAELLERLEATRFTSPRLVALRASLDTDGVPPSKRIARLRWLVDLADSRRNQFFLPISALLLVGTQVALAVEAWRRTCGPALGRWLEAAGEIEALCSIAGYAYEQPQDPFPQLVAGPARLEARGLGHPLLPLSRVVRNDVSLAREPQALIVSGSNMSGKSTLLRSLGVNAVLAQAGAPVRAEALQLSPLGIGASIQVHDSLQEGASRFYAEITRLRQIVDAAEGERPLLFLLDEILHGTNSHDRRVGAEAVVRGLLARGALGLVSTHDLALAQIAEDEAGTLQNVHFVDHLEEGRVAFDYQLRPGVVTRSNALELMRAVGLDV
ncbi:MAG: DNA mismatch repair protein MutS [Proteobacteria bacterium]|nr:DNA mismatch repair protein MutS [Pseudomonadota bacterium]